MRNFVAVLIALAFVCKSHAAAQSFTLRVASVESAYEMGKLSIKMDSNKRDQKFSLPEKSLSSYSLVVNAREVNVNKEAGFLSVELIVKDKTGKAVGYSAATVPSKKFSLAAGFTDPTDSKRQVAVSIDNL